jgi:hypothetical protein
MLLLKESIENKQFCVYNIYLQCFCIVWRRSILVGADVSKEGPKNPLKGISVKPLVSAWNAQFRVDAGGRRIAPASCRATPNGMGASTLPVWRPDFVGGRTPFAVNDRLRTGDKPVLRYEVINLVLCAA